jgi:hypothetical protein
VILQFEVSGFVSDKIFGTRKFIASTAYEIDRQVDSDARKTWLKFGRDISQCFIQAFAPGGGVQYGVWGKAPENFFTSVFSGGPKCLPGGFALPPGRMPE